MAPDELYWTLVETMETDPRVRRSTLMGFPCLRLDAKFFASLDRDLQLVVKLPQGRVQALIASGRGRAFAPAGRVFREWVAIPVPDAAVWRTLLDEAKAFAA